MAKLRLGHGVKALRNWFVPHVDLIPTSLSSQVADAPNIAGAQHHQVRELCKPNGPFWFRVGLPLISRPEAS